MELDVEGGDILEARDATAVQFFMEIQPDR